MFFKEIENAFSVSRYNLQEPGWKGVCPRPSPRWLKVPGSIRAPFNLRWGGKT